jgi:5-methyltetrahydrofolate--homocysteine methyltransferase
MHKKARDLCGYGRTENLEMKDIIREKYRGIRPAPGYPACPDHTEKPTLFALLDATAATGITLTESNAMNPASSVSGLYLNHPDSKYFAVGKLGGAIYGDRRYNRVFVGHNGADSYYSGRGFRGWLKV